MFPRYKKFSCNIHSNFVELTDRTLLYYRMSGIASRFRGLERSLTGVYREDKLGYGRERFGEDKPFKEFRL